MNLPETEMLRRCCKGERTAQLELYNIYSRQIYNTCYRILQNQMDAEDAMQECFLKVFAKLEQYTQNVPLGAWVTRIAVNTSIDKLRSKNIDMVTINENIEYGIIDENETEDWETTIEMVDTIKKAITELPDNLRIIMNLYLIEGYDHEEIADILNIKVGTSRVQYMRAKQKVLNLLEEYR